MRIGTMGAALASATLALANVAGGQGNEQGRSTHGGHGGHGAHGSSAPASELPAAARAEIERVRAAVARYRDLDAARADGFVRFGRGGTPLMGEHWYRPDLVQAPLDLARPSTLQYAVVDGRHELVGVAYTVYQRPGDPLPDGFAGDADHWHAHDLDRIAEIALGGRPLLQRAMRTRMERRPETADGRTRLVMLHLWLDDAPDGPFAMHHRGLPYRKLGLPASYAAAGTAESAMGLALIDPETCRSEARAKAWVAQATAAQRRTLERACADAADDARAALQRHRTHPEPLNRAAADAWGKFQRAYDRTLTAEQRARVEAITEL